MAFFALDVKNILLKKHALKEDIFSWFSAAAAVVVVGTIICMFFTRTIAVIIPTSKEMERSFVSLLP